MAKPRAVSRFNGCPVNHFLVFKAGGRAHVGDSAAAGGIQRAGRQPRLGDSGDSEIQGRGKREDLAGGAPRAVEPICLACRRGMSRGLYPRNELQVPYGAQEWAKGIYKRPRPISRLADV